MGQSLVDTFEGSVQTWLHFKCNHFQSFPRRERICPHSDQRKVRARPLSSRHSPALRCSNLPDEALDPVLPDVAAYYGLLERVIQIAFHFDGHFRFRHNTVDRSPSALAPLNEA